MAGGHRPGRGFLLRPVRPVLVRPQAGGPGSVNVATTTTIPLEWSFTIAGTLALTTVATNDEDAWRIPLEWSFLIDLDPADDVEGDP